jgi:hypothetical protein
MKLRDVHLGGRFAFPDEPQQLYVVIAGAETGRDRVTAEALTTEMNIHPTYVFDGAEEVHVVDEEVAR